MYRLYDDYKVHYTQSLEKKQTTKSSYLKSESLDETFLENKKFIFMRVPIVRVY